jgi:hypothetical protein
MIGDREKLPTNIVLIQPFANSIGISRTGMTFRIIYN